MVAVLVGRAFFLRTLQLGAVAKLGSELLFGVISTAYERLPLKLASRAR